VVGGRLGKITMLQFRPSHIERCAYALTSIASRSLRHSSP
jgi:hypothetical protein